MAFMDDPQFVISQIRHSCVTSDDTGMSEIVIVNEESENERLLQRRRIGGRESSEVAYPNSFDIDVSPIGSGMSNSVEAPPIQPPKPETQTVTWKDPEPAPGINYFKLFPKQDLSARDDTVDGKPVSKLALLVEKSQNQPKNPFAQYGKFDGEGYARTNKVRVFKIFFPMPNSKGPLQPPMNVCLIVHQARVQDLIGLIMFKYTEKGRMPELKDDVKSYCLLIADEVDGEVDFDLPALENNEMISRFEFKALALSYVEPPEKPPEPKATTVSEVIVEVLVEKYGSSKFAVEGLNVEMQTVKDKILKKRAIKRTGDQYALVKGNEPTVEINLKSTLKEMGTLNFQLVKKANIQSKKKEAPKENGKILPDHAEILTSVQYKVFKVTMLQGILHAKSEVQLGIDLRNIEITQTTQSSQRPFWSRSPIAVNIEMEYVVHAEVIRKSGSRSTFRIVYCHGNHEFKNYDFECTLNVADEIVRKIEHILNFSSKREIRTEYQRMREKRSKKS